MSNLRIGQGFDAHKIIKGSKDFILGGIAIDSEYEVVAHSDGDIISHAIIDALLGACKTVSYTHLTLPTIYSV